MKLPALRAKIGNWEYYVTTLTFAQVRDHVSRIDDQLHKSDGLKDMIQRSLTSNITSIKKYIINQQDRFFNSLVLAVYDDYPNWREIEIRYDETETYQLGLLEFPGNHKIFPVDGQHRVEGIKEALIDHPELAEQKIAAIFIGHKKDNHGMQRRTRLFSTLNRYAKPVTMDDIIALDEDDAVAIVTRDLLEEHPLLTKNRVTKSKNKAISNEDKDAFTSIITLYECNRELLKKHRSDIKRENPVPVRDNKSLVDYLKFRPCDEELEDYKHEVESFWNEFSNNIDIIKEYIETTTNHPAQKYRNNIDGGNLLFRPVGLLPFIQACIEIQKRERISFKEILEKFNSFNLQLNARPWKQVLWNEFESIMIMGNQGLTKLLLMYKYDENVLRSHERINLTKGYAAAINFSGENLNHVLEDV